MAKQPSDRASAILNALSEEQTQYFKPNESQRKLKARFWYLHNEAPFTSSDKIGPNYIEQLTGNTTIPKWWSVPGFRSWFMNETEFEEKVQYLQYLALDALEEVVLNTDPKAQGPRVNAIKVLLEVGNKMPNRWAKENFVDKAIGAMDKVQLLAFLEKNGITTGFAIEGTKSNEVTDTIETTSTKD